MTSSNRVGIVGGLLIPGGALVRGWWAVHLNVKAEVGISDFEQWRNFHGIW